MQVIDGDLPEKQIRTDRGAENGHQHHSSRVVLKSRVTSLPLGPVRPGLFLFFILSKADVSDCWRNIAIALISSVTGVLSVMA
jgi:hypothetical protein